MDPGVFPDDVLHLHGEDILPAGDNHVLLSIHDIDEAIFVHLSHIAGIEPAVPESFRRFLGVLVIALHHPVALNDELPHLPAAHVLTLIVDDAHPPVTAG